MQEDGTRRRLRIVSRGAVIRIGVMLVVLVAGGFGLVKYMTAMPGESWGGPLPEMTDAQRNLASALKRDVTMLGGTIGERNVFTPLAYARAAAWIESELRETGVAVSLQRFEVEVAGLENSPRVTCVNVIGEKRGTDRVDEVIVVGAHYDTVSNCAGANDNATGVAATLALARAMADVESDRTLRFVLFANEEPPYFQTEGMGSNVYAKSCRDAGDDIVAMISLETMGFYSESRGSQRYPMPLGWFYPDTGDFIGFVGNLRSRSDVREWIGLFRENAAFPSEGGAIYGGLPGVGWSDHWAFWQHGYDGLMVTDTAPFRYPHYHTAADTPEKIDYERLARVVEGLERALLSVANPGD